MTGLSPQTPVALSLKKMHPESDPGHAKLLSHEPKNVYKSGPPDLLLLKPEP